MKNIDFTKVNGSLSLSILIDNNYFSKLILFFCSGKLRSSMTQKEKKILR